MLDITIELDVRKFCCPMPLLKAKQALSKMATGEVLRVLTTDVGSVRDFRRFSELTGHCLLSSEECEGVFVHTLKKHE
ncbi:MAG: sulfurtransferase TusA family protein [Endozoicomonadaceae bacterium]|nr:sulfurtransferase TusA family protein [Endozoicomonadaceae bacterium]